MSQAFTLIKSSPRHPRLPGLFDPRIPNNPALWAVLLGHHPGQAVVDDDQHPSQCVVRTDAALTYASRLISRTFLKLATEKLRQAGPVWLVRSRNDPEAPGGYRVASRLEFYEYDPYSPTLEKLRHDLPDGFDVRKIDMHLLNRCEWRADMAFYCGSLDNFLHHSLGICLMRRDEIIVEAYASALGNPYAEIGAITHEPFRGRGYAAIAVAHLIDTLEQRGYHAYWSCDVDNPASMRVARKLGFNIERPYEIWVYEANNA